MTHQRERAATADTHCLSLPPPPPLPPPFAFVTTISLSFFLQLSDDERIELAKHVYDKAAGRVKVVGTGTFEGTVEEQAAFCKRMDEVTDAVVVLICKLKVVSVEVVV